jgi:hypothetical protein
LETAGRLFTVLLSIRPIFQFLDLPRSLDNDPELPMLATILELPNYRVEPVGITLHHLDFSYPGAQRLALKGVNLASPLVKPLSWWGKMGQGNQT